MAMPADPIRDVIDRTMRNLDFIKSHEEGLYPVTQLVNSFLCALIQPWDTLRQQDAFLGLSIEDAEGQGWPHVECTDGTPPQKLRALIKEMRDSLSHGNVEFLRSTSGNDISGLRLTTWKDRSKTKLRWRGEITVSQLEQFLSQFASAAAAGPIGARHSANQS